MKKATGGYVTVKFDKAKQDGVVGYILGTKPVYDADWFDQKIGNHAFKVEVNRDIDDR